MNLFLVIGFYATSDRAMVYETQVEAEDEKQALDLFFEESAFERDKFYQINWYELPVAPANEGVEFP